MTISNNSGFHVYSTRFCIDTFIYTSLPIMSNHPSFHCSPKRSLTKPVKTLHNTQAIYLRIGDQLKSLLTALPWGELHTETAVLTTPPILHALITIFQYTEGMTDQQASKAVCSRLDWKYALHLPVSYSTFAPNNLCEFRTQLLQNKMLQSEFDYLLNSLTDLGLMPRKKRQTNSLDVMRSVCTVNQIGCLLTAMNLALEILAIDQAEWLQTIMLPHWVDRYPWQESFGLPVTWEKQNILAQIIAKDIFYLLETIKQTSKPDLTSLTEITQLQTICQTQFIQHETELHWLPGDCTNCLIPRFVC